MARRASRSGRHRRQRDEVTLDDLLHPRDAKTAIRTHRGGPWANMLFIAVGYGIFALSLTFQPRRWAATPAYHDLLIIMPQQAWGGCFAFTAVLLGGAAWKFRYRWLSLVALAVGIAISTAWDGAFVVRWLTSPNTTPETWVSWAAFDYLLLRALILLGHEEVQAPGQGKRRG